MKDNNYISVKYHTLCLLLVIAISLLSITSTSIAENKWILLHRAKGNGCDVFYDKQSIKKINDDVFEIYISFATAYNKQCLEQIRIDCKNRKTAMGMSELYINGTKIQSMDFSNAGWRWTSPSNIVDKKLIKLICKKK